MTCQVKILIAIASNVVVSGAEQRFVNLLHGLKDADVGQLALVAPAGGTIGELALALGISYYPLQFSVRKPLSELGSFRKILRQFEPDVVHAHGSKAALFARLSDKAARERVIYTLHGVHANEGRGHGMKLALERGLRSRTAQFVTLSEADKQKAAALDILDVTRTTVIESGISPLTNSQKKIYEPFSSAFRRVAKIPEGGVLVLSVGRAQESQRHLKLLTAFSRVCGNYPLARLTLVLSGDTSFLRQQAEALGISSVVSFMLLRADMTPVYLASDVFVLSSNESMVSYEILEAANASCAIIAASSEALSAIFPHSDQALLLQEYKVENLTDALQNILTVSTQQRQEHGRLAQKRVNTDYTRDEMVQKTTALYQTLLMGQ